MYRLIGHAWVAVFFLTVTASGVATAQDAAVDAACEVLQREHQEALAASAALLEEYYYGETAREQFACVGSGDIRWAQTLTVFPTLEHTEEGDFRLGERHLYRVTAAGAQLIESEPFPPPVYVSPTWTLSAVDFDNDGSEELVETRSDALSCETHSRILTWRNEALMAYSPAESYEVVEVRDVNGDGRPDLLLANPFKAYYQSECRAPYYAFLLPAIAQADGSFSTSDPSVQDYVRERCPVPPSFLSLPGLDEEALDAITCARFWGVSSDAIMEEINRLHAVDPEGYDYTMSGFDDAALGQAPFLLSSSEGDPLCDALRQEHEQAVAASAPLIEGYVDLALHQFACVGTAEVRWAQSLSAFHLDEGSDDRPVAERRLYRLTAGLTQLVEANPVHTSRFERPWWRLVAADYGNDGQLELVEVSGNDGAESCGDPAVRVLTWENSALVPYAPAQAFEALDASDINGDALPDLLLANPISVESGPCVYYAFLMPAVAQADGSFSTTDPAVAAYLRTQCPRPPSFADITYLDDTALAAVTCARYLGTDSALIERELERIDTASEQHLYDLEELRAAARVDPNCPVGASSDGSGGCWSWDAQEIVLPELSSDWLALALDPDHALIVSHIPYLIELPGANITPQPTLPFHEMDMVAARLTNGQILVVNGAGDNALFDLSSGWTESEPVGIIAPGHHIGPESLWLFPEANGDGLLLSRTSDYWAVHEFDLATRSWTELGDRLYDERRHLVMVGQAADGDLLVMGGTFQPVGTSLATVQRFDRQSSHWSAGAPIPEAGMRATLLTMNDGRILLTGGTFGTIDCTDHEEGCVEEDDGPRDTTWIYDPASDLWSAGAPMAQAVTHSFLVGRTDGTILAIGSDVLQRYDPVADSWSRMGEFDRWARAAIADSNHGAFLISERFSVEEQASVITIGHLEVTPGAESSSGARDTLLAGNEATPPADRAAICTATTHGGFHLRPRPTAESIGTEFQEGRELEILAPGNCTRRGSLIFEVRDVLTGQTGWVFLTDGDAFDVECPPFAEERAAATECP